MGGEHYKRLEAGLDRLKGTSIKTNILSGGARIKHGFGLIDDWKIIERSLTERMIAVEVTLSEWLYNAIAAREVLTLNRDYFRLGGALERRLYELARKHCGNQARWAVRVELLHRKSGSASPLKRFRHEVKRIAVGDDLPEYRMNYESDGDQVTFYTKGFKALAASLSGRIANPVYVWPIRNRHTTWPIRNHLLGLLGTNFGRLGTNCWPIRNLTIGLSGTRRLAYQEPGPQEITYNSMIYEIIHIP